MCYAILRIAYHHDKVRELVEVEKFEQFDGRLNEIRNRPGVRKVTTFFPGTSFEEVRRWEITDHNTGQVAYEEGNKSAMASYWSLDQENVASTGQSKE